MTPSPDASSRAQSTGPQSTGPEPAEPRESYFRRIQAGINALGAAFAQTENSSHGRFSSGDLAELRRLDHQAGYASTGSAFWRIVVEDLEPRQLVGEAAGEGALRPWLAILQGLATLGGLHQPQRHLGSALVETGISEARLTRLLSARGDTLLDQLRPLAHQLRSQNQAANWAEAAQLVLSDGRSNADRVRQGIARSFYSRRSKEESVSSAEGS
jgi:CRISPR type I-E-associated protein CasB/Cse2